MAGHLTPSKLLQSNLSFMCFCCLQSIVRTTWSRFFIEWFDKLALPREREPLLYTSAAAAMCFTLNVRSVEQMRSTSYCRAALLPSSVARSTGSRARRQQHINTPVVHWSWLACKKKRERRQLCCISSRLWGRAEFLMVVYRMIQWHLRRLMWDESPYGFIVMMITVRAHTHTNLHELWPEARCSCCCLVGDFVKYLKPFSKKSSLGINYFVKLIH